jgi:hypothetical protein
MLLGDLLAQFTDQTVVEEAILSLGDLSLLATMRLRAEAEGLALGAYAVQAMNRYTAEASDEEWIALMGALGRSQDPSMTYLQRAFEHARQG